MALQILESISLSLVREFLKRKGLSSTYQELDKEHPRDEGSISNRTELAKILHIEKLLKRNKESHIPLKTILEVITRSLIDREQTDDELSYQPPIPRPKSRRISNAHNEPLDKDLGLLITEDDLETELIAGRGMHDVYQGEVTDTPQQVIVPPHSNNHKHRRTKRHTSRQSSDTGQDPAHRAHQINYAGHLTAGTGEVTSAPPQTHTLQTENTTPENSATPDTSAGQSQECSSTEQSSPCNETEGLSPTPAPSSPPASEETEARDQQTEESPPPQELLMEPVSEKLTPKPPPKMPDYLNSNLKNNLEKSMELLRQRRMSQLKADSVIGGFTDKQASAVDDPIKPTEENVSLKVNTTQETPSGGDIEEDSYSPRIICSPLPDKPEQVSDNPETGETAIGSPVKEVTITKQPVSYMSVKSVISTAKSIDVQTAMELKRLVLGSASMLFYDNWLYQGIRFCDIPTLMYGMIQHRTGTCGLLSVIQASFIVELLFCDKHTKELTAQKKLSVPADTRSRVLASAISKMLWRCGEEKRAVLALPSDTTIITGGGRYKPDTITETLMINTIDNYEDVLKYTNRFISYFEDDDSNGAILLLYSAVLSRGIEQVIDDMDVSDTPLLTSYATCSQELVNLLLCGKAASNVFNDSMEVTQGLGKPVILKGIPARCDVGFLSLLEHQNRKYQVGTFVKTPKHPVWITFIDDHYSVVFCVNKDLVNDWKAEKRFDLIHHDTLAQTDTPVRLSIDTTNRYFQPPENDEEIPPLELVIRTKWRDAQIDWNEEK